MNAEPQPRVNCRVGCKATKKHAYLHWSRWRCRNARSQNLPPPLRFSSAVCRLWKNDPGKTDNKKKTLWHCTNPCKSTNWSLIFFSFFFYLTVYHPCSCTLHHQAGPLLHMHWHKLAPLFLVSTMTFKWNTFFDKKVARHRNMKSSVARPIREAALRILCNARKYKCTERSWLIKNHLNWNVNWFSIQEQGTLKILMRSFLQWLTIAD